MGIPGILREIGKGERIALSKLAVEHLEKTRRPLRVAIDAAIWNFQAQSGQGGKNPALRTLYYKLLRLLALPIHPVFVYDGKNKPLVKRGRTVTRWGTNVANEASKILVSQFRFPYHTAPGEAEAECALLQRQGIVDMVMSQDGDAIMFGSAVTLRDWSKEGTKGNKTPTHVNLLDLTRIKERSGLDPDGMVLVALLSGGDYDQNGLSGFGPGLACEIARAGFGTDLILALRQNDDDGLIEWRDRLQFELETNESGYFKTKHKSLKVPDTFPDRTIVEYYLNPAISGPEALSSLERNLRGVWDSEINICEFRQYVGETFDWLYKPGAWKFVRGMAPALLANKLRRGMATQYVQSIDQITERRQHFVNDGIPELRISTIPAGIVGLDLDAEADSPEYLARMAEEQDDEDAAVGAEPASTQADDGELFASSQSPTKVKRNPSWNPFVPEKMWIAEVIVQLGVPTLVEQWHRVQQETLSDPLKFATRKCKSKANLSNKIKPARTTGAMKQYLLVSKSANPLLQLQHMSAISDSGLQKSTSDYLDALPRTPDKRVNREAIKAPLQDISNFFKPLNAAVKTHYEPQSNTSLNSSREDDAQLAGSSVSETINISSSPILAGNQIFTAGYPCTPTKEKDIDRTDIAEDTDIPIIPASVTQRKKKSSQVVRKGKSDAVANTKTAILKPISSFFGAAANGIDDKPHDDWVGDDPESLDLPAEPSTGLVTEFSPKRVRALPRESLPGTWKEFDLEEDIKPTKSRRHQRVSYVDLTIG